MYVNSRTRTALAQAEHASIGAYFEVELGANWVDQEETFHVNGEMRIQGALGLITARCHMNCQARSREPRICSLTCAQGSRSRY